MPKTPPTPVVNPHIADAGYASARPNKITGNFNVLYNSLEQGLDSGGGKWAVMCIEHSTHVSVRLKRSAESLLGKPETWCGSCVDLRDMKEAKEVLDKPHRSDDDQLRMWAQIVKGNEKKCVLFEELHGVKPDQFW